MSSAFDRVATYAKKVRFASEEDLLWPSITEIGDARARVIAWAPSPKTYAKSRAQAQQLLERAKTGRRVRVLRANDMSVVLVVSAGHRRVLLGGDLENTGDPATGWTAVVASDARLMGRSEVFKVPHHGSRNGYHPGVWKEMLVSEPLAAVTAFSRSRLPRPPQQARLLSRTPNVYVAGQTPPASVSVEDQALTGVAVPAGLWIVDAPVGQVRLRAAIEDPTPEWEVKCRGNARRLVDSEEERAG